MGSSRPQQPQPTAAQRAFETQQQRALSREIQEENRRRRALIRGQLGAASLLSGTRAEPTPIGEGVQTTPGGQANQPTPAQLRGGAGQIIGRGRFGAPGRSSAPGSQGAQGRRGQLNRG